MGKPLTKLQRIAISYFLIQSIKGNYDVYRYLYEGGKILFDRKINGGYNMFVQVGRKIYEDTDLCHIIYTDIILLTLEESEDIDTNIEYRFAFDPRDLMFHIMEIQI